LNGFHSEILDFYLTKLTKANSDFTVSVYTHLSFQPIIINIYPEEEWDD